MRKLYIIEGDSVPALTIDLTDGYGKLRPAAGRYRLDFQVTNPDGSRWGDSEVIEVVERPGFSERSTNEQ